MTPGVRPLVAGNWKMNGLKSSLGEIAAIRRAVEAGGAGQAEVLICPPTTLLMAASESLAGGSVALGGQDCHVEPSGPFTGDISAEMIKDAGASYVIVGHSERRAKHLESDAFVKAKATAALRAGLTAIICVGESRAEREAGEAIPVVSGQLRRSLPDAASCDNVVIAYEPIWAVGTGLTPTPADIAALHEAIRALLTEVCGKGAAKTRLLYGGSVKPANARELLGLLNVDGALIGGASLRALDFMGIAAAYV